MLLKKLDRGRSRTCNLLIRSQTRCHFATRPIICVGLLSPTEATKRSLGFWRLVEDFSSSDTEIDSGVVGHLQFFSTPFHFSIRYASPLTTVPLRANHDPTMTLRFCQFQSCSVQEPFFLLPEILGWQRKFAQKPPPIVQLLRLENADSRLEPSAQYPTQQYQQHLAAMARMEPACQGM